MGHEGNVHSSVVDPHHIDAGPDPTFHFDADPDLILHFDADPDPDPTFYFDADPDPDPTSHFDTDPDPPRLQNELLRLLGELLTSAQMWASTALR
jgi:hypothetical protein